MHSADSLSQRDPARDAERISKRIDAFAQRQPSPSKLELRPARTAPVSESAGLPTIAARDLDARTLKSAIASEGALIVRGLLSSDQVTQWRKTVDTVVEESLVTKRAQQRTGKLPGLYDPPEILNTIVPRMELESSRYFHRESGSTMCAEAPRAAEALLALYEQRGLRSIIADYLEEKPCLSVKKWVLRKSKLPIAEAGWHQDGAFMGTDIRSLNLWLPLTTCGGSSGAPGLDLLPRRLNNIIDDAEATFDWSVSPAYLKRHFGDTPTISPVFSPGDGLFFDHYYLHRTQFGKDFSATRYAIETWFFGENSFPKNQIPLAW